VTTILVILCSVVKNAMYMQNAAHPVRLWAVVEYQPMSDSACVM